MHPRQKLDRFCLLKGYNINYQYKFIGTNRGRIQTDNGIIIKADEFIYNKELNILKVYNNHRKNNLHKMEPIPVYKNNQ